MINIVFRASHYTGIGCINQKTRVQNLPLERHILLIAGDVERAQSLFDSIVSYIEVDPKMKIYMSSRAVSGDFGTLRVVPVREAVHASIGRTDLEIMVTADAFFSLTLDDVFKLNRSAKLIEGDEVSEPML